MKKWKIEKARNLLNNENNEEIGEEIKEKVNKKERMFKLKQRKPERNWNGT